MLHSSHSFLTWSLPQPQQLLQDSGAGCDLPCPPTGCRYPTFIDALRDLDDALSMCFLFSTFPRTGKCHVQTIQLCWRLAVEFQNYVIASRSLRKVGLGPPAWRCGVLPLGTGMSDHRSHWDLALPEEPPAGGRGDNDTAAFLPLSLCSVLPGVPLHQGHLLPGRGAGAADHLDHPLHFRPRREYPGRARGITREGVRDQPVGRSQGLAREACGDTAICHLGIPRGCLYQSPRFLVSSVIDVLLYQPLKINLWERGWWSRGKG